MKHSILGMRGFLGSALASKLDGEVYNYLRPDVDRVYFFASPSSQFLFDKAPDYCEKETMDGFKNVMEFCKQHNIKLVYPSSATVYNLNNRYATTKARMERWQQGDFGYGNTLALRIFAGYGPGEGHKGEYASVVYQFCKLMAAGKQPVIWGDGTQTRDFVYIDDIVDTIMNYSYGTGVRDVGTGINTSFNEVVKTINKELGTRIEPIYIDKPLKYIEETPCRKPIKTNYSLREGVREILASLS